MTSDPAHDGAADTARLLKLLCLLWLAGAAMRVTIIAVPPVIPLIHDDLGMTETQVGLLMGLPVLCFAVAAVPGSLLVARLGALTTLLLGLTATAVAGAARGAAASVWQLYALTLAMGCGVAITQPALPVLVRNWLPQRIALAMAVATNGMLAAVMIAPAATIPIVLPLVGQSWRLDLAVWSAPVLIAAVLFAALAPRHYAAHELPIEGLWWPDWKSPLTWLLGLTFGCSNAAYFGANAFLPEYLTTLGRPDLIGPALAFLNGAQLVASFVMLFTADRLSRGVVPYLFFGPLSLAGLIGIVTTSGIWIVVSATVLGFGGAIIFATMLALPPLLSRPGDAHRTAAGMFTISFTCAAVIPTLSGALWDLTGVPWAAFVPLALCAVGVTVLGSMLTRYRSA